jgi:ornithine cyclodeaminase/alanine dehydrogenase-like protein (mu-crystallin family)
MAAPPPPRIATFEECLSIIGELPHDTVIDAMATGFVAYSRGEVSVPPIQSLGQPPYANFVGHPDAQACIKSAYVHGGAVFVMKVASGGGGRNSGMVLVFSQVHFAPVAIFLDNGYLTELRTAAAGALAAREFAPRSLSRIAIIGCGIQARWQLRLLTEVVACRTVVCYARRPEQAAELVQEMGKEGWETSA